ncbi:hypothetical protein EDB84DRAFT_933203 [Lactarius hengduanensis]|nr:hypothetical protein EDB84DRAFT_933203 [Lactarius hengduanensis]
MLTIVAKLSPIPQIEGVIFAVKSIMDTVEGAKHNKYGLSFVSGLRELVVQALEQADDTRTHPTMEEQFMALVVTPLREFAAICPETTVVLVIDGVDKCPADTRPAFLAALRAGIPRLPSNVKVFLASCQRGDVRDVVEPLEPLDIYLAVGDGQDDGDIELYLQCELLQICKARRLERTWSPEQVKRNVHLLSVKAGGLFQWAKLAITLLGTQTRPREMIVHILNVANKFTVSAWPIRERHQQKRHEHLFLGAPIYTAEHDAVSSVCGPIQGHTPRQSRLPRVVARGTVHGP